MAKSKKQVETEEVLKPNGEITEQVQAKIKTQPRETPLPGMESTGNLQLENLAIQVDDIDQTKKTLTKTRSALAEQMLTIMKQENVTVYQHAGFLIEREEKGENIKIKSIQVTEE